MAVWVLARSALLNECKVQILGGCTKNHLVAVRGDCRIDGGGSHSSGLVMGLTLWAILMADLDAEAAKRLLNFIGISMLARLISINALFCGLLHARLVSGPDAS